MPYPDLESSRWQIDSGKPARTLSWIGSFLMIVAFILDASFMAKVSGTLGHVHLPNTVIADHLGIAKGGADGFFGSALLLVTTVLSRKRSRGDHATVETLVVHVLAAIASLVLGILTFVSYGQEGYDGLVGSLANAPVAARLVPRKGNNGHHNGPPAPPVYFTDPAGRNTFVNIWLASGAIELVASIFSFAALALWVRTRKRNGL